MIINIILAGGLSNQLFQYLAVKNIVDKNKLDTLIQLDESQLGNAATKRRFALNIIGLSSIIGVNMFAPRFNENQFNHTEALERFILTHSLKNTPEIVIQGYFISHKYLNLAELRKNSVGIKTSATAVHVRLGDYLISPANQYHGNLTEDYYKKALANSKRVHLYSDEPELALKMFPILKTMKAEVKSGSVYEDIISMSKYEKLVIANSSLSLMSAYMSNPDYTEVITPSRFFKANMPENDLLLPNWIKIPVSY